MKRATGSTATTLDGEKKCHIDINERKIAQEKLRQSEEKYRLIVETANEGIWLIDKDSKTSYVNDRMADMLGFTKEEMAGVSLFDLMDVEGKNIAEKLIRRRKLGIKEVHDFRFLRKDKKYIYASLKTSPVFDKNNNYVGALAMVTDITDNKRAEEVLIETKSKLQALIHEIPDMVIFKDLNCRHLIVNKAVEEFTGLTYNELVGKTNEEILPPDIAKTCRQADEYAMRSSEPIRYEENTINKSGKQMILDTIKAPIHDAQGKVVGLVMISRDITDRKMAEEEIRMLNAQLEQRVKERTAQLDAANKELEAFSYSVSHDLRTPLRSIDGFAHAIAEDYQDRLDDTGRAYINRMRLAVKKMTELIEAMLSLSRMTRGEIQHEAVDLSMIARKISDELKAKEPQRQVEFIIQDGIVANGDARMLNIVLDNLISNAWKFTSKHPVARIEFGEKVFEGNTEYFVRDDGAGFDKSYDAKLFSAFSRLHTEAEFPGIGIGLATVARIIHRHGGKVRAEGAVEKGATFYFSLKK